MAKSIFLTSKYLSLSNDCIQFSCHPNMTLKAGDSIGNCYAPIVSNKSHIGASSLMTKDKNMKLFLAVVCFKDNCQKER